MTLTRTVYAVARDEDHAKALVQEYHWGSDVTVIWVGTYGGLLAVGDLGDSQLYRMEVVFSVSDVENDSEPDDPEPDHYYYEHGRA